MFNFMFHRLVLSLPFFLVKAFKSIHFLVNIILDDLTNFDMQHFSLCFISKYSVLNLMFIIIFLSPISYLILCFMFLHK